MIWSNLCKLLKTEFNSKDLHNVLEQLQNVILSNRKFPEINAIEKQDDDKIHLTEKEIENDKIMEKNSL